MYICVSVVHASAYIGMCVCMRVCVGREHRKRKRKKTKRREEGVNRKKRQAIEVPQSKETVS